MYNEGRSIGNNESLARDKSGARLLFREWGSRRRGTAESVVDVSVVAAGGFKISVGCLYLANVFELEDLAHSLATL